MTPQCDLILLTWNRPDLLKPCVKSILAGTKLPSRLLIVDNGTTDPEALDYMDRLQGTDWVRPEIVRLPSNIWISQAINQGLSQASAPWVCLLNNDIIVTEGWLEELMRVAENHPNIGLLNPMSNEFGMTPHSGEGPEEVARRLGNRQGEWMENWGCSGFCVLMPGIVLREVGYYDDRFEFFYFEDADYSLRVRQAGFDCGIALGAYVYHLGSATLKRDPARWQRYSENEERFLEKWQREKSQRVAWVLYRKDGDLSQARSEIRRLANEDHKVWVFHTRETADGVPRHLQVIPVLLPGVLFEERVFWRMLVKKKRFDRLCMSSPRPLGQWAGRFLRMPVSCGS